MQTGSFSIVDQRFLYEQYKSEFEEEGEREGALDPQQIEEEYGALRVFYLIVSKSPMNWDFPIGLGHFRASGSFMMKRMSFKRMIQSSCRVKPCSTRQEIDLPKNKAFF
ncbi:protein ycf2 [Quercus suber]|uniref:Protein ycf2 n=1 Tax=Quercus suber TaxID=58331 RepID=A0AAW0LC92_QUESU